LEAPGYASVVHISPYERRQRYAVLTLVHRGQRLADEEYAAQYPGLLTDGIENSSTYRYRDIVADVLTGLEWLTGRAEVDAGKLGIAGSEPGLIAASMRSDTVKAVLMSAPLILRGANGRNSWPNYYPLEELNDFVRSHPDRSAKVSETLIFFDPLSFVPEYSGEMLVACPQWDRDIASPLISRLGGSGELYLNTGRGHVDHSYMESWLEERLTE
jgi:cephalosporin-C deacetylase-like acetyl esterase